LKYLVSIGLPSVEHLYKITWRYHLAETTKNLGTCNAPIYFIFLLLMEVSMYTLVGNVGAFPFLLPGSLGWKRRVIYLLSRLSCICELALFGTSYRYAFLYIFAGSDKGMSCLSLEEMTKLLAIEQST
jgi:hypothetical protein